MDLKEKDKGKTIDVIIPTYKPDKSLEQLISRLQMQTVKPGKIILMNTEEKYLVPFLRESEVIKSCPDVEIHHVGEEEFDHGATRDLGVHFSQAEYFLCMTQDAMPVNKFLIEELLRGLERENIAVVYGRQMAAQDSHILEKFTRNFNYPDQSCVKSRKDLEKLGIKTYFCSNVCAAYNRNIYDSLGGFIKKTIFNEDMIYAAGAVQSGYGIGYEAKAAVIHSHHYTGKQQFKRNFDLGVSQADHPEIFENVPSEKEGGKMVYETIRYLFKKKRFLTVVPFFYQCFCKYAGYCLGKKYRSLPYGLIKKCSMNRNYWAGKEKDDRE